jgi:hypothetical protein
MMQTFIEIIIGICLAFVFIFLIRRSRSYTKEKHAAAIGLVSAALVYVGFGLFSASARWNVIEPLGVLIYAVFAWLGFKKSGWFLAVGWALHVVWDWGLHGFATPFVPHWYIGTCVGFDFVVAGYIALRELKK